MGTVFHEMVWPWTLWGTWQWFPESCTLSVYSAWCHVCPWVHLICRVQTLCTDEGNVGRASPARLLLGLSQVSWSWSYFEISFMQVVWEGVCVGCYMNQGPGNGRLHCLSPISCPRKAELRVLVLTGRNEDFSVLWEGRNPVLLKMAWPCIVYNPFSALCI